jgi:hypothetical protein
MGSYLPASFKVIPLIAIGVLPANTDKLLRSTQTYKPNYAFTPPTPHGVIPTSFFWSHTFVRHKGLACNHADWRGHGQTPETNPNLQTKLCIYTSVPLTGSYLPASFEVIPRIAIRVFPANTNKLLRSTQTYKPNYAITPACFRSLLRSQPDLNSSGFNTFSIINSNNRVGWMKAIFTKWIQALLFLWLNGPLKPNMTTFFPSDAFWYPEP